MEHTCWEKSMNVLLCFPTDFKHVLSRCAKISSWDCYKVPWWKHLETSQTSTDLAVINPKMELWEKKVSLPHLFCLFKLPPHLPFSLQPVFPACIHTAFLVAHHLFRPVSHEFLFHVLMSHVSDTSSMASGSAIAHMEFYRSCPIRIGHIFCNL